MAEPGGVGCSHVISFRSDSPLPRQSEFRLSRERGARLRSRSPLQADVRRHPLPRKERFIIRVDRRDLKGSTPIRDKRRGHAPLPRNLPAGAMTRWASVVEATCAGSSKGRLGAGEAQRRDAIGAPKEGEAAPSPKLDKKGPAEVAAGDGLMQDAPPFPC